MAWLRREDLEDREVRLLAPVGSRSRESGRRRLGEPEDPLRTAFQRDRDRVIHSSAFRRLQHKTQVVAAYEGDHFRSRMVHSLEVSQMARGVARALRLNHDLAEAVALAHDLGHPPFGHVGEETLHELMNGEGGFRHNAQGLRIVDYLEDRYGHRFGLNLTEATRRSLLKGTVPDGFPLSDDLRTVPHAASPIEAQVVDHCDRIAYLCHDLDDGLRAEVFAVGDVGEVRLWRQAADVIGASSPPRVISEMISLLIHDLVQSTDETLSVQPAAGAPGRVLGGVPGGVPGGTRTGARVRHSDGMTVLAQELLAFLRERFYRSRRVLSVMEQGQERIRSAFTRFCDHPDDLPEPVRGRIPADGMRRTVCDYVAGMTDRFLVRLDLGLDLGREPGP